MLKDIKTEIKNKFYKTSNSVKLLHDKLRAIQDKLAKAAAPSKKRLFKFWSLLATITALSAVAQCHA